MASMLLHRLRAERLLREQFEALRAVVTGRVAARLRGAGVQLDAHDLEACYAIAWHGLYAAVLDGQEIASPVGWLALVTYRRAIDEHRACRRIELAPLDEPDVQGASALGGREGGGDALDGRCAGSSSQAFVAAAVVADERRDLASELDDRMRLRQLLEAFHARLSSREREAAALCYLHGLSRAEAAVQMGISEPRMRKLMDGHGGSRPGVSAKLGAFVEAIEAGRWCDEQGSLMRAFAYGMLDSRGERYRLARAHQAGCSSCRAYVLSLRGLAAVLPPVPAILHWALGTGAAAGAGAGAGSGVAAGTGAAGGGGAAVPVGAGSGGAALTASGAAGAGAAGGGWWLVGGPVGAKLAVGCLLALGVGAGCVALEGGPHRGGGAVRGRRARTVAHAHDARANGGAPANASVVESSALATAGPAPAARSAPQASAVTAAAARASREFGLERPGSGRSAPTASAARRAVTAGHSPTLAGAASIGSASATATQASTEGTPPARPGGSATGSSSSGAPAAQREFAPG